MEQSTISKSGTAVSIIIPAIVTIAANPSKDNMDLYCVMILAGVLVVFLIKQAILDWHTLEIELKEKDGKLPASRIQEH